MYCLRYAILFLFLSHLMYSQKEKIRIKKDGLVFFQKGKACDTISFNKNDLFYIRLSESFRCNVRIDVQNGQLQKTNSDTIVRLVSVKNINYFHTFTDSTFITEIKKSHFTKQEKKIKPCYNLTTFVNGANSSNERSVIIITFYKNGSDSILLKNKFIYR